MPRGSASLQVPVGNTRCHPPRPLHGCGHNPARKAPAGPPGAHTAGRRAAVHPEGHLRAAPGEGARAVRSRPLAAAPDGGGETRRRRGPCPLGQLCAGLGDRDAEHVARVPDPEPLTAGSTGRARLSRANPEPCPPRAGSASAPGVSRATRSKRPPAGPRPPSGGAGCGVALHAGRKTASRRRAPGRAAPRTQPPRAEAPTESRVARSTPPGLSPLGTSWRRRQGHAD